MIDKRDRQIVSKKDKIEGEMKGGENQVEKSNGLRSMTKGGITLEECRGERTGGV